MKPHLTVKLAAPRGFCAGVVRAIDIVERALKKYGAPVYVRHEIVHNRFVVEGLEAKGAVFIDELDEAPTDRPVIFSAHGVPKAVPAEAERRNMHFVDATCPLVSKVHREAERAHGAGKRVFLIGHDGHPEVIGTLGQLPPGAVSLIGTAEQVEALDWPGIAAETGAGLAYVTQTTLSVDDTREVIDALHARFPSIKGPDLKDICYATQNRQNAVKALVPEIDLLLVVGSANSSNSSRLRELGERSGVPSYLVDDPEQLEPSWFTDCRRVGVTAGASAPEALVNLVLARLTELGVESTSELEGEPEEVVFQMPPELQG